MVGWGTRIELPARREDPLTRARSERTTPREKKRGGFNTRILKIPGRGGKRREGEELGIYARGLNAQEVRGRLEGDSHSRRTGTLRRVSRLRPAGKCRWAEPQAIMPSGKHLGGGICVYRQLGPGTSWTGLVTVPLSSLACRRVPAFCFLSRWLVDNKQYRGFDGSGVAKQLVIGKIATRWSGQRGHFSVFRCSMWLALVCGRRIGRPKTSFGSGPGAVIPGILARGNAIDVLQ